MTIVDIMWVPDGGAVYIGVLPDGTFGEFRGSEIEVVDPAVLPVGPEAPHEHAWSGWSAIVDGTRIAGTSRSCACGTTEEHPAGKGAGT